MRRVADGDTLEPDVIGDAMQVAAYPAVVIVLLSSGAWSAWADARRMVASEGRTWRAACVDGVGAAFAASACWRAYDVVRTVDALT